MEAQRYKRVFGEDDDEEEDKDESKENNTEDEGSDQFDALSCSLQTA
jgi:hypothetical protein